MDSSRIMIGKYVRGDNAPSVDFLIRLTNVFEVSVDFLLGQNANASYDKEIIKTLKAAESLPPQEKDRILHFIDLIIRDNRIKQAYNR